MTDDGVSIRNWLLLDGDRHLVAAMLLVVIGLVFAGLGYGGVVDLTDQDGVQTVAGGTIPGLFTFLSIVLAINQLVLSQEFGSADEIRTRLEEIREFRHDVEDLAGAEPSPMVPTGFLAVVVETIGHEAAALEESVAADGAMDPDGAVATFAATVQGDVERVLGTLERVGSGRFNALLPVLEYPESRQLYEARAHRTAFEEELSEESEQALEELVQALNLFSVAKTHFRTTYTQRVLARLSRLLLYVGVPALVSAMILGITGVPDGIPDGLVIPVVSALLAAVLAPLAILFAYILRIAAVSERTISVGPFLSRPGSIEQVNENESGPTESARFDERASDAAPAEVGSEGTGDGP